MNEIDALLKRALRRSDPPEGFAERVLRRVHAGDVQPDIRLRPVRWKFPLLRWAAVAAMVALIAGGVGYREHERRVEEADGLAAKQQVMVALRITGNKLRIAKERVKAVEGDRAKTEDRL